MRDLFLNYKRLIATKGSSAAMSAETRLATDGRADLYYIPFERVNRDARLVIVGITPGPTQLELAYGEAQAAIQRGLSDDDVLREVIRHAGFGGKSMRPNLLRMLQHFRFRDILGIDDEEDLFGERSDLLHSTSTVPHAAFLSGKMFAGSFEDVRRNTPFNESFLLDFVPSLSLLRPDALFVALGPTPLDALEWCAAEGHIRAEQIIGAFAHPSSGAGSQVDIFLGSRRAEDLKPTDPVRNRAPRLLAAYQRTRAAVEQLLGASVISATPAAPPAPTAIKAPVPRSAAPPTRKERPATINSVGLGLQAVVKRGAGAGTVLTPHRHEDGMYVVSPTRFEADYVRVPDLHAVAEWVAKGYSVRMSAVGRPPSLISASSIIRL